MESSFHPEPYQGSCHHLKGQSGMTWWENSSLLGLRDRLEGNWLHQGLFTAASGSAMRDSSIQIVQLLRRTRVLHIHFTCLKLVGSLLYSLC